MSEDSIISLKNVNKWFGDFHVLQDVNLEVKKKERIVVCGPSGSGKSTMIRCINRLEEHQEGKIVVDGIELTGNLKNIDSVRKEVGQKMILVVPGIRIEKNSFNKKDDQKRTLTPKEAINLGADFLVIGRPIIKSKNPLETIKKINKSMQ